MLIRLGHVKNGYNEITNMKTKSQNMLMDIGVQKLLKGQKVDFFDIEKETALLLLDGNIIFKWNTQVVSAMRNSLFDENPSVLHVPKNTEVTLEASVDSEVLVQKTTNPKEFDAIYYSQDDCICEFLGDSVWNDAARRLIRTVFDYKNAPYSNMVLGELINYPGRWSSYIPHGHAQPEVYYYRFDRKSGFGAGFIEDKVFKIEHNSALCIPGGPTHPQVAAPGYAMYYTWMIRHLENDPWVGRTNDEKHTWLLENNVKIWPEN